MVLCSYIVLAVSTSKPTITVTFDEPVDVSSISKSLVNSSGYPFELVEIFRSFDNTTLKYKPLNHLAEGDYTFTVQARDIYGNLGDPQSQDFTVILPPLKINLVEPSYGVSDTDIFDIKIEQSRESYCRWSRFNVNFENMDEFDTAGINYSVIYDFDMTGKYKQDFYVICNDSIRKELISATFELFVDSTNPVVEEIYANPNPIVDPPVQSLLYIRTDEETICKYGRDQPIFELMENKFDGFDEGIFSTLHTKLLDNLLISESPYTFYAKCMNKAELLTETDDFVTITIDLEVSLQITNVHTPPYSHSRTVALNLTTNKNAVCYYATNPEAIPDDYLQFTSTGQRQHIEILNYLQEGSHTYYIRCTNGEEATTQIDFIVDLSSPDMIYVNDTGPISDEPDKTYHTNKLKGSWLAEDEESGISEYYYFVLKNNPYSSDTVIETGITTNEEEWVTGLELEDGAEYYFKVYAVNRVGLSSSNKSSDGITVDTELAPETCDDGEKNGDETDIDCGGSCPACARGNDCKLDSDCISNFCNDDGKCATPTCNDYIRNGDETDIDCGGDSCPKCGLGKDCEDDEDCESAICDFSTKKCTAETDSCENGILNADEADVDCGGICPLKCPDGSMCINDNDCISNKCVNNICCGPSDLDCDGLTNDEDDDIDGDGIPNDEDPDDDNDGLCDTPDSPLNDESCNGNDHDDDGDEIPDPEDKDEDNDFDNDGIPNEEDDDIDGDGIPNWENPDDDNDGLCDTPNSPFNDPDICVGNDLDDDNDGIPDQDEVDTDDDTDNDGIPNDEDDDVDGDGIPNWEDPDNDNDGICDTFNSPLNDDSCIGYNPDVDNDDDGILNDNDPDVDGDGELDQFENSIWDDPNGDIDGDGIPNIDDPDIDGDGILNGEDPDVDGDGFQDQINVTEPDMDDDNDGILDQDDKDEDNDLDNDGTINEEDTDTDGDGIPDDLDPDDDNDGLCDDPDSPLNDDSCTVEDLDDDNDGIPDEEEDDDRDGLPNWWELKYGLDPKKKDSNNDGVQDGEEDPDEDDLTNIEEYKHGTNPLKPDTDNDGYTDGEEIKKGSDPLDLNSVPKSKLLFYLVIFLAVAFVGGGGYYAYTKIAEVKKFSAKGTKGAPGVPSTISTKMPVEQLAKQKIFKQGPVPTLSRFGKIIPGSKIFRKISPEEALFKKREFLKTQKRSKIFEEFGKEVEKKEKPVEEKKEKPFMDIEKYIELSELSHGSFKNLKGMSETEFKKLIKGKSKDEIRKILGELATKKPIKKEELSLFELELQKYIDLSEINEEDFRQLQNFSIPEIRILFKGKTESQIKETIADITKGIIRPKKILKKEGIRDIFEQLPKKEEKKDIFSKLEGLKPKYVPEKQKIQAPQNIFDQLSNIVGKKSAEKILSEKPKQTFEKLRNLIQEKKLIEKPLTPKIKKDAFEQLSGIVGEKSAHKILSEKPKQTFEKLNQFIKEKELTKTSLPLKKDTFTELSKIGKKSDKPKDVFEKLNAVSKKKQKK